MGEKQQALEESDQVKCKGLGIYFYAVRFFLYALHVEAPPLPPICHVALFLMLWSLPLR